MYACTGNLSNSMETRQGGSTVAIDYYTAHTIMGRRSYGQQIFGEIEAILGTYSRNGGETSMHLFSRQMAQVEVLAISLFSQHLAEDGASHDITRGKLGLGSITRHETLTGMIAQVGSFAAHCLRNQVRSVSRYQHRWMELHEFQVGQCCSGMPRQGKAISSSSRRIGGVQPEPASTSARQDCRLGLYLEGSPIAINGFDTGTDFILHQQTTYKGFCI